MTTTELAQLAKVTKTGWKKFALADQDDSDELVTIIREILEAVDAIEEAAKTV